MLDCNIRLAQVDSKLGNIQANLELHLAAIDRAIDAGVDLIVFPELALTGYFLKDQTTEVALRLDDERLAKLRERSTRISIAIGLIERGADERVYNSLAFFEDGEVLHVHRKVHLVTYGMFEDARDVAGGEAFKVVESKLGRFGVLTCEDAWHVDGAYSYFLDGVDAMIVCSASPGRGVSADGPKGLASTHTWSKLLEAHALFFRTWIVFVNRVGCEDGVFFGGGSRIVDPFGSTTKMLGELDPEVLDVELSQSALVRARQQTPLRRDEKPWILWNKLSSFVAPEAREREEPE